MGASFAGISNAELVWPLNLLAHLAFLSVILLVSDNREMMTGSLTYWTFGALAVLGNVTTGIGAVQSSSLLLLLGSPLMALGSAGTVLLWAKVMGNLSSSRSIMSVVFLSALTSMAIFVVISMMPHTAGGAVMALLPVVSLTCCKACMNQTHPTSLKRGGRLRDQIPFWMFIFFFAMPVTLFSSGFSCGLDHWHQYYACALIVVVAVSVVVKILRAHDALSAFPQLVVSLFGGGLVMLPLIIQQDSVLVGTIMVSGQTLFFVYSYSKMGEISRNVGPQPFVVFSFGIILSDTGALAGSLLGIVLKICGGLVWPLIGCLVVILINLAFMEFKGLPNSAPPREDPATQPETNARTAAFEVLGTRNEQGATLPMTSSGGRATEVIRTFSNRYGLSPREQEVLRSLLKGNTLGAIAENDHVSLSTIKTHVSHIFRKTGVHTRDDLIALVDAEVYSEHDTTGRAPE